MDDLPVKSSPILMIEYEAGQYLFAVIRGDFLEAIT